MAADSNHVSYTAPTKNINTNKQLDHVRANLASNLRSFKSPSPSAPLIACVADLDNLCSRRGQRGMRARACLDALGFLSALRERGVTKGTVFQNQKFGDYGSKLWSAGGLKCVATGQNVDPWVERAAIDYAASGARTLIIIASDGGYDETIHAIRRRGVRVELWALRAAIARHLMFAADEVRWIDHFVREPGLAA